MSISFDPMPRSHLLRGAAGWLSDAKAALMHSGRRVSGLSDRDLRDIGVGPRSLASTVYREVGNRRLVDFGWRLGR